MYEPAEWGPPPPKFPSGAKYPPTHNWPTLAYRSSVEERGGWIQPFIAQPPGGLAPICGNISVENLVRAKDLLACTRSLKKLSTGSKDFDSLLGGGLETGALTEFYGDYGSGKTQLCHTLCVLVRVPVSDGCLSGNVLYIDTENTFRASRLHQIAETRGYEPSQVLDGIFVQRAYNLDDIGTILSQLPSLVSDKRIKLVILDSAISLYRAKFAVNGTLSERQQTLNRTLHSLKNLAEDYACAVVLTNQVRAKSSLRSEKNSPGFVVPTGGNIFGHASTFRILLRKGRQGQRFAKMIDSPCHPECETQFSIGETGFSDAAPEGGQEEVEAVDGRESQR